MRKKYIAGNWKMHRTIGEAVSLTKTLVSSLSDESKKIMIAPPFTALSAVAEALKGSAILLGAQNMGPEEQGAHTGEVSCLMLTDIGVTTVILGHSERRHTYGEDDSLINEKTRLALTHGLEVILCVGETLAERERGITEKVVEEQVKSGLKHVKEADLSRVTIAYEPVWAIGTGRTATPEDADTIHQVVRSLIGEIYDKEAAEDLLIQYGGSVKPENVKDLMRMPNIDGALVGGASLKAETFVPIVRYE